MIRNILYFGFITIIFILSSCQNAGYISSVLECRKLGPIKESYDCIKDLSIKSKIVSLCDYAASKMKDCQISFKQNNPSSPCRSDACYLAVAKSKSDCKHIAVKFIKQECLMKFSSANESEALCDDLEPDQYRNLCFTKVAESFKTDSFCDKISNQAQDMFKKTCYLSVAQSAGNETICLKLSSKEEQMFCKALVQQKSGGTQLCKNLSDKLGDLCFVKIANSGNDPTICSNIEDINLQFTCLLEISSDLDLMPDFCEQMNKNKSFYEECLHRLARDENDCMKILDDSMRKKCLDRLTVQKIDVFEKILID